MHINVIKGDFIYAAWDKDAYGKMNKKIDELINEGYKKIETEHDFQNAYHYYQNKDGDEIVLTELCL